MHESLQTRVKKYAKHFTAITEVDVCLLSLQHKSFEDGAPNFCEMHCPARKDGGCNCLDVHLRSCLEAERWDGRYTYYCPLNFVFIATHCYTRTGLVAGLVAGPVLLDEPDLDAFSGLGTNTRHILSHVPVVSTEKAYHFGETLAALLFCCATRDRGFSPTGLRRELINRMFDSATESSTALTSYSIEMERRLAHLISGGDSEGALQLISQILSYLSIAFLDNNAALQSRCTELLVVMSRASIEAGADIESTFLLSEQYFKELAACSTPEDMGVCLSTAAASYTVQAQSASAGKHSFAVSNAINYIRQNYMKKITLDSTAKMVYLSRSYFSKLFSEETGTTFSNYVIAVRIEKSKQLLLNSDVKLADVAYLVGFVDQSYYTKCFRKLVGVSPGKFRNCKGVL